MQDSVQDNLLEVLLSREDEQCVNTPMGVVVGHVVSFTETGVALVNYSANPTALPVVAKSTVKLNQEALGAEVVLVFETADIRKPIIIGVVQPSRVTVENPKRSLPGQQVPVISVERDGEKVVVSAEKEIVLRCGEASITLTRAGKILLKGTYVISRSSGVNRIKGGAVQIN